jgi:hypothetical protein
MNKSMTARPSKRRSDPLPGWLKAALVIGSLVTSVVGAGVIAVKDAAAAALNSSTATNPAEQTQPTTPELFRNRAPSFQPAVPTVVAPAPMPFNPVTSTHSSR